MCSQLLTERIEEEPGDKRTSDKREKKFKGHKKRKGATRA